MQDERYYAARDSLAKLLVRPKIREQNQAKTYSCSADHKNIGNDNRFVDARSAHIRHMGDGGGQPVI